MNWRVPRMWDGGEVWIIGGGPSMPQQFGIPKEVIQSVIAGTSTPSVYSPYMKAIHEKHVIGINVSFMIGTWIDVVFFGDGSFFLRYKHELAAFPGLKVSCDPKTSHYDWVKTLERDADHGKGISQNPRKVSWNHNSGAAAISMAVNAGAKRIILLGFDMQLAKNEQQHWHDMYRILVRDRHNGKPPKSLPFDLQLLGFPVIAADAKRIGVEILQIGESAITCFQKIKLEDVL